MGRRCGVPRRLRRHRVAAVAGVLVLFQIQTRAAAVRARRARAPGRRQVVLLAVRVQVFAPPACAAIPTSSQALFQMGVQWRCSLARAPTHVAMMTTTTAAAAAAAACISGPTQAGQGGQGRDGRNGRRRQGHAGGRHGRLLARSEHGQRFRDLHVRRVFPRQLPRVYHARLAAVVVAPTAQVAARQLAVQQKIKPKMYY